MSSQPPQKPLIPEVAIQGVLLRCKTCAGKGAALSEATLIPGSELAQAALFGQVHRRHATEMQAVVTAPPELVGRVVTVTLTHQEN